MNIHYLQHVPFEGLGSMQAYFEQAGDRITSTQLYDEEFIFPSIDAFDCLVVMGGPMGIYDEDDCRWLHDEKRFIAEVIGAGKIVLGICLGAQLIADVLDGRVYKNTHREIGWFDVRRNSQAKQTRLGSVLPETLTAFHWHGDTFTIPPGAVVLAESDACQNQGFIFDDRVVGLQFHLETTPESAQALIEHCADELSGSRYVQSAEEMLAGGAKFDDINKVMAAVLDALRR